MTSSSTNGTFTIGDTVSIQVVFSEAVTVSGTPRLTLETGSTDRAVDYASGSGTTTLTFTYTVQTGDSSSDLDYVSTSSLALNGGSIVDAASNAATLTLPAPGASGSLGANKAIVVTSAPTKVVSVRTPVGTASGAAFTTQPQVSLQDSGSNVVVTDNSTVVTASVSAGATLVGTTTATASSGVATFSNLGISGTAGTAYTITYSASYGGNALTVATQSVTPTVGSATQIAITTQPVGATAGAALSTQPVVKILDSGNNTVTAASASISASASGGTLGGTTTINTSSGIATFTDLTFAGTASTNYTLTFAATGFTSQTSSNFSVGVGTATKLVLTTSAATAKYGQAFATQPVVQVQDAGSNVVTSSSAQVTASLSSGTVVGTGNATSSSGVATFSGLGITGSPGSYTITSSSGALATASQSITVARADQSALTISSTSGTYGTALTLTTSGGSGTGSNSYVVVDGTATGCAESGGSLTVTSAGTCTVTATKALDTNYNAVSSSATTVTFAKANQSALSVTSVSGTYGSSLTLTTSGGTTAGSVTFVVTGTGCSITAGALSKTAAGDCSVTATMAGNGNYEPVSSSATT
ncbi:MAG: beta strand repeat-containing protein, partial [Actinomycetes bacterium]